MSEAARNTGGRKTHRKRDRLRSLTNDQLKHLHTAAPSAPQTSLASAASLALAELEGNVDLPLIKFPPGHTASSSAGDSDAGYTSASQESNSSAITPRSPHLSSSPETLDASSETFQNLSANLPWSGPKARSKSAEGTLLEVQHRHAEALLRSRNNSQANVTAAGTPEEENIVDDTDAGTLRGTWRRKQGHTRGKSEIGLETTPTEPESAQSFITFPGSASPPPLSPPLPGLSSASAAAALRRSNTTAGVSSYVQAPPVVRPRIESLRDLVGAAPPSSAPLQANWKQHGSLGASSRSQATSSSSAQGASAPSGARPSLSNNGSWARKRHSTDLVTEFANYARVPDRRDSLRGSSQIPPRSSVDAISTAKTSGVPTEAAITAHSAPSTLRQALEAKVVILGSQGVGKTSILQRYTTGNFECSSAPSTIGASFYTKRLTVSGSKVRLQLWDTAGQERFRSMAPMYYRGSHAAIVVYDITNRATLNDLKSWVEELQKNMGDELSIHIVGTKKDLDSKREVTLEEARETIRSWMTPVSSVPTVTITPPTRMGSRMSNFTNTLTSSTRFPFPSASSFRNASGGFGKGRKSLDQEPRVSSDEQAESAFWKNIDICEVSAKDGAGIEELFVRITQKLVDRRVAIEREQALRERNSIILTQSDASSEQDKKSSRSKASCCTS